MEQLIEFLKGTGFYLLFGKIGENWPSLVMICVSLFLLWLGIKKKFEPLLLVGIAFGMLSEFGAASKIVPAARRTAQWRR